MSRTLSKQSIIIQQQISIMNNNNTNKYKINNSRIKNNNNNNNAIQRTRPTHFLGLKVDNINLETIADQLKSRHPRHCESFIVKEKYHLSLVILTLDTEEKLNNVKLLFNDIKQVYEKRYQLNQLTMKAQLSGIGSFKERVIWAGLKEDQDKKNLVEFVNEIRDLFKTQSIEIDDRDWSPHITIAKGKLLKSIIDAPYTMSLNNNDFGPQHFNSIDLMKIGSTNKDNGYYEIIDTVTFN